MEKEEEEEKEQEEEDDHEFINILSPKYYMSKWRVKQPVEDIYYGLNLKRP